MTRRERVIDMAAENIAEHISDVMLAALRPDTPAKLAAAKRHTWDTAQLFLPGIRLEMARLWEAARGIDGPETPPWWAEVR